MNLRKVKDMGLNPVPCDFGSYDHSTLKLFCSLIISPSIVVFSDYSLILLSFSMLPGFGCAELCLLVSLVFWWAHVWYTDTIKLLLEVLLPFLLSLFSLCPLGPVSSFSTHFSIIYNSAPGHDEKSFLKGPFLMKCIHLQEYQNLSVHFEVLL